MFVILTTVTNRTGNSAKARTILLLMPDLLIVCADLDGIGDELCCLLLGHRGYIFQQDGDLERQGKVNTV